MHQPTQLDRAGIAARIPHQGSMCLLDSLLAWDPAAIHCRAVNQADPEHPLRSPQGLYAAVGIEYAAQAMALHGALAAGQGGPAQAGFLAGARQVTLHQPRLDNVPGPLDVRCERLAGDAGQALYGFELRDADGRLLVDGRASVVFNSPLIAS